MVTTLSLDGRWEVGLERRYDHDATVPGLAADPARADQGVLWYRRRVRLPAGDWTHGTLLLKGARFCPTVYVDGHEVSRAPGGMTATYHPLASTAVRPGAEILLEVALLPLADVPIEDASRIPEADWWRSNTSSCLWDEVSLRLHGPACLARVVPMTRFAEDRLDLAWRVRCPGTVDGPLAVRVEVVDSDAQLVAEGQAAADAESGLLPVRLGGAVRPWSPAAPTLYTLRTTLRDAAGALLDAVEHPWGCKDFRVEGLGFRLNGEPVRLRGGTVVWHRWARDPEARELAFDVDWFEENVVRRLLSYGANTLRFHLGMPPEALLDLCDRYGLLVQAEWSFFHGIRASHESLVAQWRDWFDLLMRHPSVAIIHPWNESGGDEVAKAFGALEEVTAGYPPQVLAHRDVIHVHKYWWSLFENLGLYYDSAAQFDRPIMVDEFGGNYLDGNGDPGRYPTLPGALLRFLGRGHTREERLTLQTEANTQMAEYWRRLGAAGFSPFCILGSPEDGSHHFLGPLAEGRPKPVWAGLAAAYSPLAVSLEVWDRNFVPGQRATLPLYLINDTGAPAEMAATVEVLAEGATEACAQAQVRERVEAHSTARREVTLALPDDEGDWRFRATLQNPPAEVQQPVTSTWRFRTLRPRVPAAAIGMKVALLPGEEELRDLAVSCGWAPTGWDDPEAGVIVGSRATWEALGDDASLAEALAVAVRGGRSVVLLDVGPRYLGQGYLEGGALGRLDGVMTVEEPRVAVRRLFGGLQVTFRELPEPESCLHPSAVDASLWEGLSREATWLWNGLRGGLVAPAADMTLSGLAPDAFLASWAERGADAQAIRGSSYYAFELAGHYAFATTDDAEAHDALRRRVRFLVEDAPALATAINPEAPITVHDLAAGYRASAEGAARSLTPLANCGANLSRTPVVEVRFGGDRGRLIISQLLTAGRLAPGYGSEGLYGLRVDPTAQQLVINMVARSAPAAAGGAQR
jgi:beta-galactosidase